ncbi:MAG: ABC transporter permease [Bacteroidetes bacterium]|nr:ABC transporter permease [Bacteroidota bacterium]
MVTINELQEGFRIALQSIWANRMRSALTTLGIVIGIVSVTLMGTALEGLSRAFDKSIAQIGADVLYVQKWPWGGGQDWWKYRNRRDLRIEHANAIERSAELVASLSPIIGTSQDIKYQGKYIEDVIVVGTTHTMIETNPANLAIGRFFSRSESEGGRPVCVIGSEIASSLFPNESPLEKVIKIGGYAYRVVGVFEKQGSLFGGESLDKRIYVPINRFFTQYQSRRGGITIMVKAKSLDLLDDTKEEVRGILRRARGLKPRDEDDFSINQQEMIIQIFNQIGGVIAIIGLFITGLSLFVGGIGIMNIMFVSVTERTKEIGIRKAIGAPRRAILLQFLIESSLICFLGGIIGIAIAFPLSLIVDQILPTAMPLTIVGIALSLSLLVGLLSGIIPAYRASKLDPVEALRYE